MNKCIVSILKKSCLCGICFRLSVKGIKSPTCTMYSINKWLSLFPFLIWQVLIHLNFPSIINLGQSNLVTSIPFLISLACPCTCLHCRRESMVFYATFKVSNVKTVVTMSRRSESNLWNAAKGPVTVRLGYKYQA